MPNKLIVDPEAIILNIPRLRTVIERKLCLSGEQFERNRADSHLLTYIAFSPDEIFFTAGNAYGINQSDLQPEILAEIIGPVLSLLSPGITFIELYLTELSACTAIYSIQTLER